MKYIVSTLLDVNAALRRVEKQNGKQIEKCISV